jgi:hypothetical protein
MSSQSIVPASQETSASEAVRCRGVTRSGIQCRWTAASDEPVAAPLRTGGHFCFWHAPRRKAKLPTEDEQQLRLDIFFGTPLSLSTALPMESSAASQDVAPLQDIPSSTQLTQEQMLRISENRQKAVERRAERSRALKLQATNPNEDASQVLSQPTLSQELTQAQKERMAQKRQEALERRHRRQIAAKIDNTDVSNATTKAPTPDVSDENSQSNANDEARSRTPERRPRRLLVPKMTASPPPLPVHLQRPQPQMLTPPRQKAMYAGSW